MSAGTPADRGRGLEGDKASSAAAVWIALYVSYVVEAAEPLFETLKQRVRDF